MGLYVNPNNINFQEALDSPVYVDKSMLIAEINRLVRTTKKFVCVSRSRRFGKTMAGNMLSAYFCKGCDSRELFANLKIAKDPSFEKYLNKLNVIKLDVNAFYSKYGLNADLVSPFSARIRAELKDAFPSVLISDDEPLAGCLEKIYAFTNEQLYLAYDRKEQQCYIPNREVRDQWILSVQQSPDYKGLMELVNASKLLVENTIEGNAEVVGTALNKSHEQICNNLNYNNEGTFQAVICLAYFYANLKYTIVKEMPAGKGVADVVMIPYVPNTPALIIELKRNACEKTALTQIRNKNYGAALEKYSGDLLFVGVNYDEKTKEHRCVIEKFVK